MAAPHDVSRSPLPPGLMVRFLSGRDCGRVGMAGPESFQIIRLTGEALWLSRSVIYTANDREVTLICEARGLRDFVSVA